MILPLIFLSVYVSNFGFISSLATSENQLVFKKCTLDVFATGFQVDVLHIITYKAFDKVNCNMLISKLHNIVIRDSLLSWISS